jgi:hypothetical protein
MTFRVKTAYHDLSANPSVAMHRGPLVQPCTEDMPTRSQKKPIAMACI